MALAISLSVAAGAEDSIVSETAGAGRSPSDFCSATELITASGTGAITTASDLVASSKGCRVTGAERDPPVITGDNSGDDSTASDIRTSASDDAAVESTTGDWRNSSTPCTLIATFEGSKVGSGTGSLTASTVINGGEATTSFPAGTNVPALTRSAKVGLRVAFTTTAALARDAVCLARFATNARNCAIPKSVRRFTLFPRHKRPRLHPFSKRGLAHRRGRNAAGRSSRTFRVQSNE